MISTAPRTLVAMHRRLTAYEVVAKRDDGSERRLGFSERRTRSALLSMAQRHGDEILAMLGDWDGVASYAKETGWQFGPVQVRFSGRTERDCASQVELV